MSEEKPYLVEAHEAITGPRARDYGDAEAGFSNIAAQWSLYIGQRHQVLVDLTAEDICWMMADLKKVRAMSSRKRDNMVDAAGYIGLIEKLHKQHKGEGIWNP